MRIPLPRPFDRRAWRSPLRGPWMASILSLALLVLFGIDLVTGYLSQVAYQPTLPSNNLAVGSWDRALYGWNWPADPPWLYALNQSLHVLAGVAAIPVLTAKLWTVMPKFYKWPPATSPAELLERLTLVLLVGSSIFLLITGVFNIAYWYSAFLGFLFVPAHYYAAFVFVGALVSHMILKLPVLVRAFRERGVLRPLGDSLSETVAEPYDPDTSAPPDPAPARLSRRGMLGLVGAGSGAFVLLTIGQSLGGWARSTALLAPRGQDRGGGPNDFQINKTARSAGITPEQVGAEWRLRLEGARTVELSREELLAMPQHTYDLPIACVEGWVTWQTWTGVRLRDLAALAGVPRPRTVLTDSIQRGGAFSRTTYNEPQSNDDRTLLALEVNGADLSLDHGYPARMIVPAAPGVHNTKWMQRLRFAA